MPQWLLLERNRTGHRTDSRMRVRSRDLRGKGRQSKIANDRTWKPPVSRPRRCITFGRDLGGNTAQIRQSGGFILARNWVAASSSAASVRALFNAKLSNHALGDLPGIGLGRADLDHLSCNHPGGEGPRDPIARASAARTCTQARASLISSVRGLDVSEYRVGDIACQLATLAAPGWQFQNIHEMKILIPMATNTAAA